jgi:SAM-dependent methyltransferase
VPAPATPDAIRAVNVRYHDAAAAHYDEKWGVSFDAIGASQVLGKLSKLLGPAPGPFGRSLEVGAGTGYFSINLLRAGVVGAATATDISPGMLAALGDNAAAAGVEVATAACDAEELPFPDASFDLVVGHAVLHHLPDLDRAFREFHRVLRPGGVVAFAGEPSRRGDQLAAVPKTLAARAAPAWRAVLRARPAATAGVPAATSPEHADGEGLEPFVDVHAFAPDELAGPARAAGFLNVRVRGEELLANWFGWANRTLEASAAFEDVPWLWRQYAFRGYLLLQHVDRLALEPRLPAGVFYNLMVTGRRG